MSRQVTSLTLLFLMQIAPANGAFAGGKECPYEAVVESDDAVARCGPGKNYYPTLNLKRGDHLVVRRQDPGGWFMVEPPAGSFSLIRADDVEVNHGFGTVKSLEQGQATVRVGSALDPTADACFQRSLSTGERVEILGEVTIPRRGMPVRMYKIQPPKGEYRWIEGAVLAPVDAHGRPNEADPFVNSSHVTAVAPTRDSPPQSNLSGRATITPPQGAPRSTLVNKPGPADNRMVIPPIDPRSRLDQIDMQFREMVRRQPSTWNLSQIEQAYSALARQGAPQAVQSQIGLRMTAVDHYKQVKAEYDDYFRLISATSRKDAELAAIQSSLAPQNSRPPIALQPSAVGGSWTPPGINSTSAPPPYRPPVLAIPNSQQQSGSRQRLATNASGARPSSSIAEPEQTSQGLNGPVLSPPIPEPGDWEKRGTTYRPAGAPVQNDTDSITTPTNSAAQPPRSDGLFPSVPTEPVHKEAPQPSSRDGAPNQPAPPQADGRFSRPSAPPQVQPARPMAESTTPIQEGAGPELPARARGPGGPASIPTLASPRQLRPQTSPQLDGAGIIQRAAQLHPGGPQHVLLAPNGRILAYLVADRGVNLEAYLGRPMGIFGARTFRPEIHGDLIVVRGLVPVRLTK